ncbi:MAG: hypothetical protein J6K32_04070 [Clostridia bacterium]|nr:hypothetical protein [Clostridia bacterium]
MKRLHKAIPLLIWALVLLPFFLGAPAAHPVKDDFTFSLYTHPTWEATGSLLHVIKDAVSYALRTWRDWQGTFTGVVIMALNPAVFSIEHYGWHAVILLLGHLAAWFVFMRHMLCRRMGLDKGFASAAYLALSACMLVYLPDFLEGVYWFNGAWFYTGAQAVSLVTLVLCDRMSVSGAGRGRLCLHALACCGLLFALGMDNYITAMMTAAALLMMALQRGYAAYAAGDAQGAAAQRRAAVRTALMLIPIGAGLLLSVLAPGNRVRMAVDGAHSGGIGWLMTAVGLTLRDAGYYLLRFLLRTPLLSLCLLMTPALCRRLGGVRRGLPPVWATALGGYLILCAMIIPHMYSAGNAGSGRVINMYHCYVFFAVPFALAMILARLGGGVCRRLEGKAPLFAALAACALAVCLLGGQHGNYAELVGDQLDGSQQAYIAQIRNEFAMLEAAGEGDDVVVPPWSVYTVTGRPTIHDDPAAWSNEAIAQYFGVGSVRTGAPE